MIYVMHVAHQVAYNAGVVSAVPADVRCGASTFLCPPSECHMIRRYGLMRHMLISGVMELPTFHSE
jgi:hypothetical protein